MRLALIAAATALVLPSSAQAQEKYLHLAYQGGPALEAELAEPITDIVAVRSAAFDCSGTACFAQSADSRPLVLCQRLAAKVGKIERFSINGRAIGSADLAKCNAKAK